MATSNDKPVMIEMLATERRLVEDALFFRMKQVERAKNAATIPAIVEALGVEYAKLNTLCTRFLQP